MPDEPKVKPLLAWGPIRKQKPYSEEHVMPDEPKPVDWNKWIGIIIAILLAVLTQMGIVVQKPGLPEADRKQIEVNTKAVQAVGQMFDLD
jgi:hypothetical protein